jgi:hypothetical protein
MNKRKNRSGQSVSVTNLASDRNRTLILQPAATDFIDWTMPAHILRTFLKTTVHLLVTLT